MYCYFVVLCIESDVHGVYGIKVVSCNCIPDRGVHDPLVIMLLFLGRGCWYGFQLMEMISMCVNCMPSVHVEDACSVYAEPWESEYD